MTRRLDHIKELIRGVVLPLDRLHEEHLRVLIELIAAAWQSLAATQQQILAEGTEAEVTELMRIRLNDLIGTHQIWNQLVKLVTRGSENMSFDGVRLENRPDLQFHLSARRASFPLIVESKIIDCPDRKTETLYCSNGLSKFLTGDYSWAAREAFMVAYVRDKSTIDSRLNSFLSKAMNSDPPLYAVEELPIPVGGLPFDVAKSRHSRLFEYPTLQPPNNLPGPIALWHLWLPV
jgi:hypothetical protein